MWKPILYNEKYLDQIIDMTKEYYGKDFKGLEDSLNTNNYDEVETFIWEKLQNGNTVECTDTETGDSESETTPSVDTDEKK